jgi:hypothetical protein
MDEPAPATSKETVRVAGDELGYGLRFLRKHGWRLAVWFVFLLLPLWGFASLVGELHEKEVFPFDAPVLNMLHAMATPTLDRFFVLMSQLRLSEWRSAAGLDLGAVARFAPAASRGPVLWHRCDWIGCPEYRRKKLLRTSEARSVVRPHSAPP